MMKEASQYVQMSSCNLSNYKVDTQVSRNALKELLRYVALVAQPVQVPRVGTHW